MPYSQCQTGTVFLFCMPNRTKRILLASVIGAGASYTGCQIGTKCPILNAKQDEMHPVGFGDRCSSQLHKAPEQKMQRRLGLRHHAGTNCTLQASVGPTELESLEGLPGHPIIPGSGNPGASLLLAILGRLQTWQLWNRTFGRYLTTINRLVCSWPYLVVSRHGSCGTGRSVRIRRPLIGSFVPSLTWPSPDVEAVAAVHAPRRLPPERGR
jgi:hypothetical protein